MQIIYFLCHMAEQSINIFGRIFSISVFLVISIIYLLSLNTMVYISAPIVMKKTEELKKKETNNTLLRKSVIKVIQRLGLTFLKHRVAAWRFVLLWSENISWVRNCLGYKKINVKEQHLYCYSTFHSHSRIFNSYHRMSVTFVLHLHQLILIYWKELFKISEVHLSWFRWVTQLLSKV